MDPIQPPVDSPSDSHLPRADAPLALSPDRPVVVFDSGVGGLSVLRSLLAELPHESFVYLADAAHVPYGDKPEALIVERTLAIAAHAHDVLQAKALVVACNTATAAAIAQVRARWPDWVVVGIEPAVKPAALQTRSGVIGILATTNTLASDKFQALVQGYAADKAVVSQACPGLVEGIEAGELDSPALQALLAQYVGALLAARADVIVLGCTHYPFLARQVARLAGPGVQVLETGEAVARETRRRLESAGLLADASGATIGTFAPMGTAAPAAAVSQARAGPAVQLLTTGSAPALAASVRHLLGLSLPAVHLTC